VLDATSALLTEVGYDQLSIDDVASRAGVHKTTVYRRWPTKPALIADAARVQAAEDVPIPDTGTLLGDLQALAREVAGSIGSDAGARRARTIIAAAASSDELAAVMNSFWAHRLGEASAIIQRAVDRRELPDTTDADLLIEAVVGPIWLRLLLTGEAIDDAFADDIAELVTIGARHPRTSE
jgi:AcrR family transcriptional regulator